MKISVIVCAHNEEDLIARCLDSLVNQSLRPDEIITVTHNCTDRTENIVQNYSGVKLLSLKGEEGVVFARIAGIEAANNNTVAFIDGDSYADVTWLENLVKPLEDPSVAGVGGLVSLKGSMVGWLSGLDYFYLSPVYRPGYEFYFWGSNCAFRKSDYTKVGGWESLLEIKHKLGLFFWAEDLYMSLVLKQLGRIEFAKSAKVYSKLPSLSLGQWLNRFREQDKDRVKLIKYFNP